LNDRRTKRAEVGVAVELENGDACIRARICLDPKALTRQRNWAASFVKLRRPSHRCCFRARARGAAQPQACVPVSGKFFCVWFGARPV
jgi:hypothetical protein